ncbi:MAG: GYD domain-containing protein [Euryarchaeota archaeon]|jgi:uncharacterized protein with GYD domain|nr:GYD domain-containing protein [Euryarchaeota archaeon]
MAKYLVQFSYTGEGLKGLLKEGGSKRREAIEQLVKSMGGKLEAYYFAYGEYDGIAIVEGKDIVNQLAGTLAINASGAVKTTTTVLITPEEVDQAIKKIPSYRPPGK